LAGARLSPFTPIINPTYTSDHNYFRVKPQEIALYVQDKIRNQMKWKEKTSFEEGIKTTVEWYLSNKEFFYNNLDTSQKTPWK